MLALQSHHSTLHPADSRVQPLNLICFPLQRLSVIPWGQFRVHCCSLATPPKTADPVCEKPKVTAGCAEQSQLWWGPCPHIYLLRSPMGNANAGVPQGGNGNPGSSYSAAVSECVHLKEMWKILVLKSKLLGKYPILNAWVTNNLTLVLSVSNVFLWSNSLPLAQFHSQHLESTQLLLLGSERPQSLSGGKSW